MTVNMLIQIDKLVQLLESPVFTCSSTLFTRIYNPHLTNVDLRLQLLEPEKYPYLYKCLYGVLMLLPQSSAFAALKNRLNSVSNIGLLHPGPRGYVRYNRLKVRHKSLLTAIYTGPHQAPTTAPAAPASNATRTPSAGSISSTSSNQCRKPHADRSAPRSAP